MQVLWIGCLESDEEFKNKAKKGYDLASAQVSQKNIINGIEEISGNVLDTINGSVLPPYPIYEDLKILPVVWQRKNGSYNISVGYNNIKYINRINCKKAMIRAAELWCKEKYMGEELIIYVYSMRSASMATACWIKKRIKSAKIYLIVTDLPQFMDLGQNKIKAFLKKIDWINIKRMQSMCDGFILYAQKMASFLEIPDGKWIVMEGSYDDKYEFDQVVREKAIMYSGKLDEQYGVKMLINAFMKLDIDYELWISGGGNAEDYIRQCSKEDKRIKFFGFLPNREKVLIMQNSASLLINMRLPTEPASDYCFPSKLFEYMATGIPVLSFKLGGIPKEYYQYLCLIESVTEQAIGEAIVYSINHYDEAMNKGKAAREFIVKNKTITKQCEKIYDFVRGNKYEKNSNH